MKRQKFELRCPKCGAEILSESRERHCYKCETKMILIGGKNE